jgi:hypothetical protein
MILYGIYYLVESKFQTKHQVADYAEMLNKSPKTTLIYSKYNEKSFAGYSKRNI